MKRIRFSNLALADLENIAEFIGRDSQAAARRVVIRIEEMCFVLVEFSSLGALSEVPRARKLIVPDLRYKIIYEVYEKTDTVVILRIYHGARNMD